MTPAAASQASGAACGGSGLSTASELLRKYRGVVLRHPSLDAALVEVERALAPGVQPQIVLLLGPTGVGKTTLVEALERGGRRGSGLWAARVVRMTCLPAAAGRRGYDFGRSHWRLITQAVGDPFADEHLSPDAVAARRRSGVDRRDRAATTEEYRLGVLHYLRELGPRAVVLDEAQHMTRVPGARSQADQLDVIKDCVDRTEVPHVLVGTYELSVMVAPGDQLGRRSHVVHFAPYSMSDASARAAFQKIFGQLVAELPLPDPGQSWSALREHLRDVYVGCAGCVGILKDWLCRGLQQALEAGGGVVDWPLMEKTKLSEGVLYQIAEQIRAYRELATPARAEIERALGLDAGSFTGKPKRRSSVWKPGKRLPVRDPVGVPSSRSSS